MAHERRMFDRAVESVIAGLPIQIRRLIEQIAVIVEDRPGPDILADLGIDPSDTEAAEEIMGLHTGTPLTEAGIDDWPSAPTVIHLFRDGIIGSVRDESGRIDPQALEAEIRTTLLHEVGHHFGLDEDDLDELGYG
jgi:predicted Zn-dependent protease with MMP-like domain